MSAFFTELAQSIFTPGPTPTLLIATNVTFACLQAVLLSLLIATFSIHFIVLSLLSAGLWWSINWFVSELKAVQSAENRKKSFRETKHADDTDTDADTVIDTGSTGAGSKAVENVEKTGELKDRGSMKLNKSETSTEDEWERVSETERTSETTWRG